jgi:beta-glucosidase
METYEKRARELLSQMSLNEKMYQLTSDINLAYAEELYDADGNYLGRPDPLCGTFRNPAHFMHYKLGRAASAKEACELINEDVRRAVEAQPHHIPPIEQGESLHGASWGMATHFPQPIALASSFDVDMQAKIGDAIGKECACVGVRQVFSPVINMVRDCRWGRTVETYGEDVKLTSDMAVEMCKGLEKNGVIASPKHFCDNFADGGRDSNYSDNSERTMREYYLVPFKACFDAGAQSTMAAYNSWDGVPCHASKILLTDILRNEWGFKGYVVSDYCGVESMNSSHFYARSSADAVAKAIKAGLDNITCFNLYKDIETAYNEGLLTEEDIDKNCLRILEAKFRLGLFDDPYKDPEEALKIVRCDEHRKLALDSARETIVLLKNNGVLPLDRKKIRKIGVFGQSADIIPVGSNYSGAFNFPWRGDDAPTPLEALRDFCGKDTEIVYAESADMEKVAPGCDFCVYFTSLVEGEGADRCSIKLPSVTVHTERTDEGGLIVDTKEQVIHEDQEESIRKLFKANRNSCVVLLNGAPIDMTGPCRRRGWRR